MDQVSGGRANGGGFRKLQRGSHCDRHGYRESLFPDKRGFVRNPTDARFAIRQHFISKDWFRILADLDRAGISNAEIARRLNVPRSTVTHWKRPNVEPSYHYGNLLITLHAQHCAFVKCTEPLVTDKAI